MTQNILQSVFYPIFFKEQTNLAITHQVLTNGHERYVDVKSFSYNYTNEQTLLARKLEHTPFNDNCHVVKCDAILKV